MNEELVYKPEDTRIFLIPVLIFPSGNDLLAVSVRRYSLNLHFYRVNLTSHEAVDLGEVSGNLHDVVWSVPGRTVLFGRMVNGLTNIWAYSLNDRSLTQITFGTGPDYLPMPDPGGKGIYFVNGQSSGALTAYHVQSKESRDIVSEDATAPDISPDGKRLTYTVLTTDKRRELWVADIDGENRLRIATGEHIGGTTWAPDNSHLAFSEHSAGTGAGDKIYIIGADGSGLRQVPGTAKTIWNIGWSLDQKNLYVSGPENAGVMATTWKWNRDGSSPEKLVDNCGIMGEVDPGGQYLLGDVLFGEKTGIYEVSLSDRNCISLLPGVSTFDLAFARDGKSFLYAVTSPGEVTIYRQPWKQGKTIGAPQVALKVPFAFPQTYETGSAYDFSKDLSTIVYARPGGHADLYLLSQK